MPRSNSEILVMAGDQPWKDQTKTIFEEIAHEQFSVFYATSLSNAFSILSKNLIELMILYSSSSINDDSTALELIFQEYPDLAVIVIMPKEDKNLGVNFVYMGVQEVLYEKPLTQEILIHTIQYSIARSRTNFERTKKEKSDLNAALTSTLECWSRGFEMREIEANGHAARVTAQTVALARAFGLMGEHLEEIQRGALLHDVGKMGILDEILFKKCDLSEEDWQVIKQHPQNAVNLLSSVEKLKKSLDIPYSHHEHWDGSGYPRGLKGEQIPLAARMFAVVDTWDALLTKRPYRMAWRKQDAIQYLREKAGSQFDPVVVEKFLGQLEKGDI